MAERNRQIEEAKIDDMDQFETDDPFNSEANFNSKKEVATFKPEPTDSFNNDNGDNNFETSDTLITDERVDERADETDTDTIAKNKPITEINQVPLALQPPIQPARPLNLPSARQDPSATTIPEFDDEEYITAYDEESDNSIDDEEFSDPGSTDVSSILDSLKASPKREKKEFNVNPCNVLAAKFMSTCL